MCAFLSLTRPLLTSPGHVIQIAYTYLIATSYSERMNRSFGNRSFRGYLSTEAEEKVVNQTSVSEQFKYGSLNLFSIMNHGIERNNKPPKHIIKILYLPLFSIITIIEIYGNNRRSEKRGSSNRWSARGNQFSSS